MPNTVTGSFTGNFRNLSELYRSFNDASTLSAYVANSSLSSNLNTKPLVDYGDFKQHIFFDKATRKLEAAFNKIFNEYPIGISGASVSNLTGTDLAAVNIFMNNATDFEKYVLNYIGGVTSDIFARQPTITAVAVVNSVSNPLIVVYRNQNNTISNGQQITLTSSLYNVATNFDNNLNIVQKTSFTADHDIFYTNNGYEIVDRIYPNTITESITRGSDLTELLPDSYFYDDTEFNLERYLAVMGRTFDEIKTYIDEMVNLNTISYDKYHRVPDGLFQTLLARQYGIDIISNALNESINSYLRSVNNKLPAYQVANVIFNRILNNLIFLLKRKGTREALESIIRIFGLPTDYITLNNFEYYGEEQLRNRVDYVNTRVLNNTSLSGKVTFVPSLSSHFAFSGDFTVEARISLTGLYNQPASGIIFWYGNSTSGYHLAYNNGRVFFRVNNTTIYTPVANSTTLAGVVSSTFVNVFGIRNSGTAVVKATWIDETVGTGTYNEITSTGDSVAITTLSGVNSALSAFICGTSGNANGFIGYIHQVKGFNVALSEVDIFEHTKNFDSVSVTNTLSGTTTSLAFHYKLKENKTIANPLNYVIDSSGNSITGDFSSIYLTKNPYYLFQDMRRETEYSTFGGFVDDNMEFTINDTTTNSKVKSKGIIVLSFNPIKAVNDDIENVLGSFNLGNLIADPNNFLGSASGFKSYPAMVVTAGSVFSRYGNQKLNFNAYLKAMDQFDTVIQGIIQVADQFIPARTKLISKGIIIEPHILDRPRNKQMSVKYDQNDYSTTADAIDSLDENVYDDSANNLIYIRSLNNSITSLVDMSNMLSLKHNDSFTKSDDYYNLTGAQSIYNSNSAFAHTLNNVYIISQDNIIYPYSQEVANKQDTAILFTTSRNIIENSYSLSSQENRLTITGNAKLIRPTTGKVITSKPKALRLEFPTQNDISLIGVTANGSNIDSNFYEFILDNKKGIDFKITSNEWNTFRGIQNLRIINLLSGNSQEFPLIILTTTADSTNLAGGQLVIKVGKAVV